jgi:Na+/serine symporter
MVAVVGAGWDLTSISIPALATVACAVGAISVTIASLGALHKRAIETSESGVALAGPVHTHSAVRAVIGACLQ